MQQGPGLNLTNDFQADLNEVYKWSELASDLRRCGADSVQVIDVLVVKESTSRYTSRCSVNTQSL